MTTLRRACVALALAFAAACGGSKTSTPSTPSTPTPAGAEAVDQTFTGTLSDGSLVTLRFGASPAPQALRSTALAAARPARTATTVVEVTGTVMRVDGTSVALSGTYDPATRQFTLSGGAYAFSGTYDGGAIQADCTVGGATVKLVAVMGAPSGVTQYCGVFMSAKDEMGAFDLVVSGAKVYGAVEGGHVVTGTLSGSSLSLRDERGNAVSGTIAGDAVSGTFTTSDGQGAFSGTIGACAAILHPVTTPTCTSFAYSAWGDCQPDGAQRRTVVGALPEGCQGGAPLLAQPCSYEPPLACALPSTNGAPAIYATLSTAATPPAATGGTIADGVYYRTAKTRFGQAASGPDEGGGTSQLQLVVQGGVVDVIATDGGATGRFFGTLATSGTTLTIAVTCTSDAVNQPIGSQLVAGYTATADALLVYDPGGATEEVFTRQGVSAP